MNDYYRVRVSMRPCSEDATDLAAAFLADAGFESFEPDSGGLTAYVPASMDGETLAKECMQDFPYPCEIDIKSEFVEGQDWNEEWEKNYFKPILIDGKCVIHSTFHTDVPTAEYDIVIDPKMAFGTGHHDTTSNMIRHILSLPLEGKSVIDMGTGTVILAILASMRGAEKVTGIEIDEAAYLNALDNARMNGVELNLIHGDASALEELEPADFFFANINRNIILGDLEHYVKRLKHGGIMLLSGFYESDVPMMLEKAATYGLTEESRLVSEAGWTALKLKLGSN